MIQVLPEKIANQIAAGEVVERPASVVKELVENALDAGATRITVETDQGGRFLKIIDNGIGIPRQSLELAFKRFATSKLTSIDDLWRLNTMGFRGEALPSIASIGKVEVVSRTADSETGYQLTLQGGDVISQFECTAPVGTTIAVTELFYNTPARLKFMKADNTELGYIQQLMTAFALGFPHISFKWYKNGKEALYTAGNSTLIDVMRQIYDKDLAESLFYFAHQIELSKVSGVLSYPHRVRKDRSRQFIFINQRWIKDAAITKLIDNLYEDLVPKQHYPVMALHLNLPNDAIDINVHPTKKEVKFKNFRSIAQLITQAVQAELSAYKISTTEHNYISTAEAQRYSFSEPIFESSDQELAPFEVQVPLTLHSPPSDYRPIEPKYSPPTEQLHLNLSPSSPMEPLVKKEAEPLKDIFPIAQMGDKTYILAHYANGLAIIDQHVAEERYYYEKFLREKQVASQMLLMSVVIELEALDLAIAEENRTVFEQFGFEFEISESQSLAIRAVPQYLKISEVEPAIRQMIKDLRESEITKSHLDRFNYLCKSMACHTAVRAGDTLTREQMEIIINNWKQTQNPYTCPHGRPIILKFTKHELDRRFLRI